MTSDQTSQEDNPSPEQQQGADVPAAEEVSNLPVPPDGGWGWVVVCASFVCNLIVDGVCFSFGIFYVELLDYFGESKGKTAWVGSLIPGMYLTIGPIVGALANKYDCRRMTIFGAIMSSICFFISTFSPNVDVLIFTYGIMGGIGFGFMYLPSIVILGFYFSKKRALATGLGVCGSGVGTFIFAPFSRWLLDNYGWRGGNWIIAAIILNAVACGMTFRPLKASDKPRKKKPPKPKKRKVDMNPPKSIIIQKIIEDKKRQRTISTGSLDGTIITRDNTLIRDPDKLKLFQDVPVSLSKVQEEEEDETNQNGSTNLQNENHGLRDFRSKSTGSYSRPSPLAIESAKSKESLRSQSRETVGSRSRGTSLGDISEEGELEMPSSVGSMPQLSIKSIVNKPLARLRLGDFSLSSSHLPSRERVRTVSVVSNDFHRPGYMRERSWSRGSRAGSKGSYSELNDQYYPAPGRMTTSFYSGSMGNIPVEIFTSSVPSITVPAPPDEKTQNVKLQKIKHLLNLVKTMFDFSLLKNLTFAILCTCSVLAMLGFFIPYFYVTDKALELGTPLSLATFTLSIIGIGNTIGRVLVGWVSDRPWADCFLIHNIALIIGGLTTALVPWMNSFSLICAYCLAFGLCIASYITLRSIVLVELLGIQKLTQSFGLLLLFQGIASIVGPPIAGTIVDITGSYTLSFVLAGVCIALAGTICLPIRRIAQWENRHEFTVDTHYSRVLDEESKI